MRVRVVVLLVLITGSLAWVGSQALSGNLVYYVTPTELLQQHPAPNERLRLGGQVVPGSVHDVGNGVDFVVTDGTTRMSVIHTGSTPALFKTGSGVVLNPTGSFIWEALTSPQSADDLAGQLASRFPSTARERIATDVSTYMESLLENGLITSDS